jgi:hypothetical protein
VWWQGALFGVVHEIEVMGEEGGVDFGGWVVCPLDGVCAKKKKIFFWSLRSYNNRRSVFIALLLDTKDCLSGT